MKEGRARRLRLASVDRQTPGAVRVAAAPLARIAETLRPFTVPAPFDQTPVDEARFLLMAAAEIEHGLLVQYLYAAYSLQGSETAGPRDDDDAGIADRILAVAVEEMGHLLNVQNLLLAIGDQPYFDRENYTPGAPTGPPYPFPFALERVDRTVLAKYVAAESPLPEAIQDAALRARVEAVIAVGTGGAGTTINHVGVLYAQLYWLFQATDADALAGWPGFPDTLRRPGWHIADGDLTGLGLANTHAATGGEFWFDNLSSSPTPRRFVQAIGSRTDAVALIRRIAEQGEGLTLPQSAGDDSHFEWFLTLYDNWDQAGVVVRAVPRFPNTASDPSADPVLEEGRITYPASRTWAHFSDVRYEILLLKLALTLQYSRVDETDTRGLFEQSAMFEMRTSLKPLAIRLMTLPRRGREPGGSISLFAGPPFSVRDDDLPRERAAIKLALRDAIALATQRAQEIRNLQGDDAPSNTDLLLLNRIAANDANLLRSLG